MRYFKDAKDSPIVSQEKMDESWIEITKEELHELAVIETSMLAENIEIKKAALRSKLAATDYKVLADYDGECTQALLNQRAAWRTELRTLEEK